MSDIKKIFQILFKRNILWISTIALIFLVLEGSSASYQSGIGLVSEMFYDFNEINLIEIKDGKILAPNYNNFGVDIENFKDEYKSGFDDDYISLRIEKLNQILEIMGISKAELDEKQDSFYEFSDEKYDKYIDTFSTVDSLNRSLNSNYIVRDFSDGQYKLNFSNKIIAPNALIYLIIFVIAILLLSGEHLTKYYEFSRMFPWTKTKTFLGKILFGFVIVLGLWLISVLLKYGIFSRSIYNNIGVCYEPIKNFIMQGLSLLAFYSIVMGVGALAGNFIGHIGLTMMALFGIKLYQYNIYSLERLFIGLNSEHISKFISSKVENLNKVLNIVLSPMEGFDLYKGGLSDIIGLFVISVLFLSLGIYWTRTVKTERSQMLLLKENTSKFVQVMAVLSTTNIVQEIFYSLNTGRLASFFIFFITMAISYKFYKILFKSRIGFQS